VNLYPQDIAHEATFSASLFAGLFILPATIVGGRMQLCWGFQA
jgi:hypothetical protein